MYKRKSPRRYRKRRKSLFQGLGKKMKMLPTILIIAMVIVCSIGIIRYVDRMAPSWAATEAVRNAQLLRQVEEQAARDREYTTWHNDYMGFVYGGIAFTAFAGAGVGLWFVVTKRIEATQRQIDGSYALQWKTVGGVKTLIDPNKLAGGIAALTAQNVLGAKPEFANPEHQLRMLEMQSKKQLLQAMPEQGFKYVATGKMLSGYYDKPVKPAEYKVVEEEVPLLEATFERLSLEDAFNQSKKNNWILGQSPDDGSLCEFDIGEAVHTGLVGATKTGKTSSTALLEMANAVRDKWHVVAFDAKQGVDWMPYEKHIEVIDADYTVLPNYIQSLENVHKTRMLEVKKHKVSNTEELKGVHYPNTLVILEEFGYMMQALQAYDKKVFKATESTLSNLMRVSRASGIYLLLIDQNPSKWSSTITANVKSWLAYRVGGKLGSGINEYRLHDLKRTGQFSYDSVKYDAWYTKGSIDKLLKQLPERKFKLLKPVEPVIDESVSDVEIDAKYTIEKTGYVTGYQSAGSEKGGYKVVTGGYDVTTLEDKITSAVTSKKPLLQGEPITADDKKLVYDVVQLVSKNKAYQALWGGKNGKRQQWLDAVIEEYEGNNPSIK